MRASAAASARYRGCGLSAALVASSRPGHQAPGHDGDPQPGDGPSPRQQRGADHQDHHGQEDHGDLVTGVPGDFIEVQGGEEEDREGGEIAAERDHVRDGELRHPQEAQVEQRMSGPVLLPYEPGRTRRARAEQRDDRGRAEPGVLPRDDREHESGQRPRAQHRARHVHAVRLRVGTFRQHERRHGQGGQAESQVEPEDPTPVPGTDQDAPDDRAQRERQPGHAGPDADRPGPLASSGIEMPQHRQCPGLTGRGAQPHDRPPGDQHRCGRGQRGQYRACAEHGRAGQHHSLAAELVGDHAEGEHGAGEGQRVGADHPLQVRHARVQIALHTAQPDAHDRVVQEGQEQQRAQHAQGQSPAATADGDSLLRDAGGRTSHRHLTCAGTLKLCIHLLGWLRLAQWPNGRLRRDLGPGWAMCRGAH